jgi:hypothetical protein
MKTKHFSFLMIFAASALISGAGVSARPPDHFITITWGGNSPEWNRILRLSGVRIGCSDAPASCVQQVDQMASSQGVSAVFLAILLNPANVAANTGTYANLNASHPSLVEVGFDDFVSQAEKTHLDPPELSRLLETVAANLKAHGSKLHFGATIYEDQLSSGELDRLQLSDGVRQSIDVIHLFPHYRKERKPVTEYIALAKRDFPNARIILGNYAYDRREYLPCSQDSRARCSSEEEINLFDQNLRENLRIASSGGAAGIEFFPASFGGEDNWKGWDAPRSCKQGERADCVQNTIAMRAKVKEALANVVP